jgi:signal transduction histidine kinase
MQSRREKLMAAGLVRQAWRAATAGAGIEHKLTTAACTTCDLLCERRATAQALEHLLREAMRWTPAGGTVEVRASRRGSSRSLEIRVATSMPRQDEPAAAQEPAPAASLRVILARLLLETQGATLTCGEEAGVWSARVHFPARG